MADLYYEKTKKGVVNCYEANRLKESGRVDTDSDFLINVQLYVYRN